MAGIDVGRSQPTAAVSLVTSKHGRKVSWQVKQCENSGLWLFPRHPYEGLAETGIEKAAYEKTASEEAPSESEASTVVEVEKKKVSFVTPLETEWWTQRRRLLADPKWQCGFVKMDGEKVDGIGCGE